MHRDRARRASYRTQRCRGVFAVMVQILSIVAIAVQVITTLSRGAETKVKDPPVGGDKIQLSWTKP